MSRLQRLHREVVLHEQLQQPPVLVTQMRRKFVLSHDPALHPGSNHQHQCETTTLRSTRPPLQSSTPKSMNAESWRALTLTPTPFARASRPPPPRSKPRRP